MQVGEVRVAEDADFEKLRGLCQCHDGWKQEYNKSAITVWTKANEVSYFKMIKVNTTALGYLLISKCVDIFKSRIWYK